MSLLSQKKACAIKIETTLGTAATLGNNDVIYVNNVSITPNIQMIERLRNGLLGNHKSLVGAVSGTATIEVDLAGKGASGTPLYADLLQACGFAKSSQIYTPSSAEADQKTVTVGYYQDGVYHQLHGAMGTVSFSIPSGSKGVATFNLQGLYSAPTDVTLPTPATAVSAPIAKGAVITLDAYVPRISAFTLDVGNTVMLRPDATNATGYFSAYITNRRAVGTIDPELTLLATNDPWNKWLNGTEIDLQYVLGTVTNNKVTIDAPKIQITNATINDRNGTAITSIAYQVNEDAFTITYS